MTKPINPGVLPRPYPPLAQRLREERAKTGRTQVDIATEAGISRAHLAKLETGGDGPGLSSLAALATIYGVSLDYLKNGTAPEGEQVIGETVQDSSEVALLRYWRLLDDPQKWDLLADIGLRIGKPIDDLISPALTTVMPRSRHSPPPKREHKKNISQNPRDVES